MVVNMAFSMVVKTIWMVVTISSASIVSILIFFPTKVDVLFQAVAQPISSKSTNPFTDIFGAGSYPNWIALTWESFDKNENWWEILRRCQILSWIVLTWESFLNEKWWEMVRRCQTACKQPCRKKAISGNLIICLGNPSRTTKLILSVKGLPPPYPPPLPPKRKIISPKKP